METPLLFALGLAALLFAGMVWMMFLGRRIGQRRLDRDPDRATTGLGVIDAAVFSLFGLLVAFTFSGANGRFDERRQLIVQEANDIGTAWLRLDLLPQDQQPALRQLFRDYVDARIAGAAAARDIQVAAVHDTEARALQQQIWSAAVAATQTPGLSPAVPSILLPALNSMIDITATRQMTAQRHPAMAIWVLFYLIAYASALLAGLGMAGPKTPSMMHFLGFPAIVASVVTLVINLEHPRLGIVSLADFDQTIIDVRAGMDQD